MKLSAKATATLAVASNIESVYSEDSVALPPINRFTLHIVINQSIGSEQSLAVMIRNCAVRFCFGTDLEIIPGALYFVTAL